jgi:hypothetical protein
MTFTSPHAWRVVRRRRGVRGWLRTTFATRALLTVMGIGGVLLATALSVMPEDRDLDHLAHRLDSIGVATTAHDAEIWYCSGKCSDGGHTRALVALPTGELRVPLRGSNPDTYDMPERKWAPASAESGYAGSLDVLYDPAAPEATVMATSDVNDWVRGERATSVQDDVYVAFFGLGAAALAGLVLAWATFTPRGERANGFGRHLA